MHRQLLLVLGAVASTAWPRASGAQETRVYSMEPARAFGFSTASLDDDRAVIGVSTSTGSARDTLGVLVTTIAPGGPAERSGIEEGNRIASINGVNLRLSPVDVGDWDMANAMSRRLTRELGKLKAGDEVELRVYSSGQTRTIKMKTVAADSIYRSTRRTRSDTDDRAALGISLGTTGSKRDTLGILVMGIDDDGPAAKIGLEEGNRIAAINGVDLRVARDDAGDEFVSSAKVRRLHRELEKVKAGDEVTLRLYSSGRTRDVKVKTVEMSSLSRRRSSFRMSPSTIGTPRAPTAPMPFEFRRDLEDELSRAGRAIERVAPQIRTTRISRVTI